MQHLRRSTQMFSDGLSIVELVIVLGLILMIVGMMIVDWSSQSSFALEEATRQDLDTIRRAIEIHQTEQRSPWRTETPPSTVVSPRGHSSRAPLLDRWGNPYRVDPTTHRVYSFGPNGIDERGEGDDIFLTYDAFDKATLSPPRNVRITAANGSIQLAWEPVGEESILAGYRIERRLDGETTWLPLTDEPLPPSLSPSYSTHRPAAAMAFYRVIAVGVTGATDSRPSNQVGWTKVAR